MLFGGLALSWFLSLIWNYLISSQILSHHTGSLEFFGLWKVLASERQNNSRVWSLDRVQGDITTALAAAHALCWFGFYGPTTHHQLCICRLLIKYDPDWACWWHRLEIKNFRVLGRISGFQKRIDFVRKELAARLATCTVLAWESHLSTMPGVTFTGRCFAANLAWK